MPPPSDFNKTFIQQILTGEKKVFKTAEVRTITMPHFDELSASKISELVRDDASVRLHMKDEWASGKQTHSREWFFNVLNTIHPGFLDQLIEHASNTRHGKVQEEQKADTILCTDHWAAELMANPYYSK